MNLSACPFCGSWEIEPKSIETFGPSGRIVRVAYACPDCRAQGPQCTTLEEARLQWNDRHPNLKQGILIRP